MSLTKASQFSGLSEFRVVLMPATRRDGEAAVACLAMVGIDCEVLETHHEVAARLSEPVGAVIANDIALASPNFDVIVQALKSQPTWSDVPVVVLAKAADASRVLSSGIDSLTNVTVIDRPTSIRTFTSAVQAALRARARQYQTREQLEALLRAEELLRAADRSKDEFLATLAHELRNPLAPLRSSLQVMELKRDPNDSQLSKLMGIMDRQLAVMVRLIDDLLDLARISSGKIALRQELVDLRGVLEVALEAAKPGLEAAAHRLVVVMPDEPVQVIGDATRIAQVVGNVLNNATKYTPVGGDIEVDLHECEGMACISVKDTGVGIPASQMNRVFDMFAQVNQTLDRAQGGLGIGLALVRKLMAMHGGTIIGASAGVGQGSTFTMSFPLAPADLPASIATAVDSAPPRFAARLLVIDDNRDAADTLAMLLSARGHELSVLYSGADAVRVASSFHPDVVFCDLGMPEMDGYSVAERLRCEPATQSCMLVAVTGWDTPEARQRSQAAGFDVHLTKPVAEQSIDEVLAAAAKRLSSLQAS